MKTEQRTAAGRCDEQQRSLADALQHKGAARAAVADIEAE